MNIIISHTKLDFDGLASMIAAQKIYPNSRIVLPKEKNDLVKEFLSLYKDAFPLYEKDNIPLTSVSKIIIVDTSSKERLAYILNDFSAQVETILWDHHPLAQDSVKADYEKVEQIGATTTLLVEKIKADNIAISSFEATVLCLGIYSDTGSLIFETTTSRDAYCAAYLLEKGANLSVVSRFLDKPLEDEQQEVLQDFLSNIKKINIKGIEVLICFHKRNKYLSGLSLISHRLLEFTGATVLFLLVEVKGKIFIVLRSSTELLQVDMLANYFGGGGHPSAASAVVKDMSLEEVINSLEEKAQEFMKPTVTAEEIMSSPVKTILPTTSVKQAAGIMLRYGHTGLPVAEEGKLLGIISRRDVDKAMHHDLGHAPVKAYMSQDVKTIHGNASISEIENILIEYDIGRLPVLKNGELVGIVTRTDVLSNIHGEKLEKNLIRRASQNISKVDLKEKLISAFSDNVNEFLNTAAEIAEEMNVQIYLVGGVVRDLILGRKNQDLDIVVEGDGIAFSEKLSEKLGVRIKKHSEFETSNFLLDERFRIDIATSRNEFYAYPAALPQIEKAYLKQDLFRRDFTINSMAVCLNKENFGVLIDIFDGYEDLKNKVIRVLHNLSFIEDPTRILRAVRFETRLGFIMDSNTESFAFNAVEELSNVSKQRLGSEFRLILLEDNAVDSLLKLQELGALSIILGFRLDTESIKILYTVQRIILKTKEDDLDINSNIMYLGALSYISHNKLIQTASINFNNKEIQVINSISEDISNLAGFYYNLPLKYGEIHRILKNKSDEVCLLVPVLLSIDHAVNLMIVYLKKRRELKVFITGRELQEIGIEPGPVYSKIMDELKIARLNGIIKSRNDEIKWVVDNKYRYLGEG